MAKSKKNKKASKVVSIKSSKKFKERALDGKKLKVRKGQKPAAKAVKKAKKNPRPMMGIKATLDEQAIIRANAKRFMKGNLSKWMRQAGQKYRPAVQAKRAA